ncbi:penicillin-binding protein 1C [Shewanella sp. NFH-SH190041]|uniref:penicillin-binding protein 1C n=1 Tax=Shewanella sp. NFH-SH190041 TaxID=2950245 RepID=UPI0021C31BD6|nr:penicillin-binding protein 1C [Shewanella sp. NFH-SH190041]BDM65421.1 penicillin-binding protein 1C [Shewanella sp. NFH-SH190041]
MLIVLIAASFWLLDTLWPLPDSYPNGPATVIISRHGEVLRSFADNKGVHRYPVSLTDNATHNQPQVSAFYLQALLNYEDRWFYYHPGFNPAAIVRAAWQWLRYGHVVSGGSTLTMQVARLISPHSRTLPGKIKQVFRAIQLEYHYNKSAILTLYLNLAPFGGNIQGVEAASRHFFGKSAANLTKTEAALLVALPQKPSRYRPDRYPDIAMAMRNKVLDRLVSYGVLNPAEAQRLQQEKIQLYTQGPATLAPLLGRQLKRTYPQRHLIHSSIRYELQQRIQRLFARLTQLLPPKSSAAIVIMDNATAEVIAYQGSADFNDASRFSHVDMARAIRSPGSTLKPFIYGQALDLGIIHSQSLLSDIPYDFAGYKPQNLNRRFQGAVSMSSALKQSLNMPLIQVFNKVTPVAFEDRLKQAGIQLHQHKANLTVGLGGTGTNLLTLTAMYRTLATGGQYLPPRFTLAQQPLAQTGEPLLSPQASWIIFKVLSEISAPDRVVPSIRRRIAWKTGTSYGYRDFWSIGVSPDYSVGVWVGRPDSSPVVGYLGATQAAPIMFDAFDQLPPDRHRLPQPGGVKKMTICWPGGRSLATTPPAQCLSRKQAYTLGGLTPATMDIDGRFMVNANRDSADVIWPQGLVNWQLQHQTLVEEHAIDDACPHIQRIATGQHYYKNQLTALPLKANLPKLNWYVNDQPYHQTQLVLANFNGKVVIDACQALTCDRRTIYIH